MNELYIAHMWQMGEDEDRETIVKLKATTYNDAIDELKLCIIGEYNKDEEDYLSKYFGPDEKIEEATLFKITNEEKIPIEEWYKEAVNFIKNGKQKRKEEEEKEELTRLKAKYE